MNTLRLTEGFSIDLYHATTGLSPESFVNDIEKAISEGLLEKVGREKKEIIRPTLKGRMYLNELLERFL